MFRIVSVAARHWPYFVSGLAVGAVLALAIIPRSPQQFLSLSTAYASFLYVAAALMVGPLKLLSGGAIGLSNRLRRDFGIWAALFAIAHVIAGLSVHFSGRFWLYFVYPAEAARSNGLRLDAFGLTNYLGLAAAFIFIALLMISNDTAIRTLGPPRWKAVQRLSYPLFAIAFLHGLVYQTLEDRRFIYFVLLAVIFFIVAISQVRGFLKRRAKQ
jgi:methionine sulfoxide reductase heme-binding subunit